MITLEQVEKRYPLQAGFFAPEDAWVYAVNGVSLTVQPGEIYGLVGESGCGKTTTARMIVRMERLSGGNIRYTARDGQEFSLNNMDRQSLRDLRSRIRYIFQDPARSLNPRLTIREVLLSGYRYAPSWPGKKIAEVEAAQLLEEVGLNAGDLDRRPADFSGGQRQRISIARALITRPEVLICDEVVSALDVSIQGQILRLLLGLRDERNLTMIFIAHDLAVVGYVSDRIGVMYRGLLMEEAPAEQLLTAHRHPYTGYLFNAIPVLGAAAAAGSAATSEGDAPHFAAGARSAPPPASPPAFTTSSADPTISPVTDPAQLVMREVAPGHRVSPAFMEETGR